jgi:hypothetical protein
MRIGWEDRRARKAAIQIGGYGLRFKQLDVAVAQHRHFAEGMNGNESVAPSGLSVSTYSIPFSSQTMHTTRVYVDRAEPMISGFGMVCLSRCQPAIFVRHSGRDKYLTYMLSNRPAP